MQRNDTLCFQYTNYVSKRYRMFPILNFCFKTTMSSIYVSNIHGVVLKRIRWFESNGGSYGDLSRIDIGITKWVQCITMWLNEITIWFNSITKWSFWITIWFWNHQVRSPSEISPSSPLPFHGPCKIQTVQNWLFHVKVQPRILNYFEFFDPSTFSTGNDVIKNCLILKGFS